MLEGIFRSRIEVGMPLTGQNNLSEGALLKQLGHIRWEHLSKILGIPTRKIVNERGERVYATFFYIDMLFPDVLPINSFVENDELEVVSTLRRSGEFLDGEHYLFPATWPEEKKTIPANGEVPIVRMGNSFVVQFKGADWLKRSLPAAPEMQRIPETPLPEYFDYFTKAKESGCFFDAPDGYTPLTDGEIETIYRIIPERDVNGVGLLYFANYPVIADVCERRILTPLLGDTPETSELMAGRTVMHRRSGYFGNANYRDAVRVGLRAWVKSEGGAEEGFRHHLFVHTRMRRESDGRLMYVTSAKKLIAPSKQAIVLRPAKAAATSAQLPVHQLSREEIVVRGGEEDSYSVGDALSFRLDTPNGSATCRGKVSLIRYEDRTTYVTAKLLDLPADSALITYAESPILRQLVPPSSLRISLIP